MKTLTLDLETTGLPPKGARYDTGFDLFPYAVSIAWKIGDAETKYLILNQEGRKVPWDAIAIHGINDERCEASSIKFVDAVSMMVNDIIANMDMEQCVVDLSVNRVIGHNLYFDISTIKANLLRTNTAQSQMLYSIIKDVLRKEVRIDTMYKSIKFCGKMPKLTELYFKLFGETFNAHNAKDDVDATYKCYLELVRLGVIK